MSKREATDKYYGKIYNISKYVMSCLITFGVVLIHVDHMAIGAGLLSLGLCILWEKDFYLDLSEELENDG